MPLRVGLAYNLKIDSPTGAPTEDWVAECEELDTVERIAAALRALGHRVNLFPYRGDLVRRLQRERVDIVFNIAEGWSGRNRESLVPAILEFLGIPYTGSDPLTLGLALDKTMAKRIAAARGVPVTPSYLITEPADLARCNVRYPAFVKPNSEGSSKGVRACSRVNNRRELLRERVEWVLETYQQPALVEPFLAGREFSVGLLGNRDLELLPIMEVVPADVAARDDFVYSFEVKNGNLEQFLCPAPVDDALAERLRQIAVKAYRALGCVDVGRVDIRLDTAGRPFFELNPLPGLSPTSLLPLQAEAAGIPFTELVGRILEAALQRRGLTAGRRAVAAVAGGVP